MTLPPKLDWMDAGIGPGHDRPPTLRVTRDNWRLYPYSRWAFQHSRELVPSRAITPAAKIKLLDFEPASLENLQFDDGSGRMINWREFADLTYSDALLVLHKGKLVHESYFNGMSERTPHHLFSVTKSFVGLLAEIAIEKGALDPARAVTDYIPELGESAFAGVNVRHLLEMTDGVTFNEDYANPGAEIHQYSAAYWATGETNGGARKALTRLKHRTASPGELFAYRTPVADALGWVLERATGKRLADLFAENIWWPAGCSDDAHLLVDIDGDEIAATGLNATTHDLARLCLWLIGQSRAGSFERILAEGDRKLIDHPDYRDRTVHSYRSQWWIGDGNASAMGVFGQRLHIHPANEFCFIKLASYPMASNRDTEITHQNALLALRRHLGIQG